MSPQGKQALTTSYFCPIAAPRERQLPAKTSHPIHYCQQLTCSDRHPTQFGTDHMTCRTLVTRLRRMWESSSKEFSSQALNKNRL